MAGKATNGYSIVEIDRTQVLSKIVTYGYKEYAFRVSKGTVICLNDKTVGAIQEIVADNDYVFFRIDGEQ